YSMELSDKKVTVGHGHGGSSGSILLELKRKHLDTGVSTTPALVLLDEDNGLDEEAEAILGDYPTVQVVFSAPQCLDGLLLDLLDDLPPASRRSSQQLKKHFQDRYLQTRHGVQAAFKQKRHEILPRSLLESRKASNQVIKEIFTFLELL
ncbi:MAG: hypothetical protein WD708_13245, partial [Kiritimatiellia bacterium]